MTKYEKISVLARETARRIGANREEVGSELPLMLRQGYTSIHLRTKFSYMHSVRMPPPVPHWKCGMRKCFAG